MLELGFFLKKMIGFWLMPLSICILLLGIGLILMWRNTHIRIAKYIVTGATCLLFLFSWQPVGHWLLSPIESNHKSFNNQAVDYVVVLGNQVISDHRLLPLDQLSSSGRSRLLEGLRIAHAQPNTQLILSGYAGNNNKSCAEVYSLAAQSLGFNKTRIIELHEPKDTHDEARLVKEIVGDSTVALITSASHMTRAMFEFEQLNINAIAAPTFYLAKDRPYFEWRFNADGLYQSERAIHERLGQIWQSIIR